MSDQPTHSARGHGYKGRSTYPLTRAMTDDTKPEQQHVEGAPAAATRSPLGTTAAAAPSGSGSGQHAAPPASVWRSEKVLTSAGVMHNEFTEKVTPAEPSLDGTAVDQATTATTGVGAGAGKERAADALARKKSKVDLISNANAKLANPLGDLTDDEVMANAAAFAEANELDASLFSKGGLLAKAGWRFESSPHLDESDKELLRHEIEHKYDQPKILYNLVIACSVAAAVQGMDESVISGAQLFYPSQFGIGSGAGRDAWLEGLINSSPYLCCAVFGCWLTDPLNRWLGRRWTIFFTAMVSFLTCIWSACTNTWWHLLIARFFLGVGIGPKSATVPVYAAECTPARIRGGLVMQWQMWTAFGIMFGYVADLIFYHVPDHPNVTGLRWRLMLGSAGFPALIVMAQVLYLPESPRWLMSKGRYNDAYKSMLRLRGVPLLAARDLYYSFVLLEEEAAIVRGSSRFIEMFTVGRNRRALYGATLVMFAQQFCGVNAIVYYTASIFSSAGFSEISALLASFGFGIINFLFAIPAIFTIDRYGRRNLLLITFPLMAIMLLFTGFMFWIPTADTAARTGLICLGIYIYDIVYSVGEGPVPFTYSAEVFPLYIRELGMSWATMICWLFNFVVAITFPSLLSTFKPQGAFAWYAAWCAILFVLILFFLPETKGFTLEELDQVFSVPTDVHANYQFYNFGYYLRKYLFMRKDEAHRELYQFDDTGPMSEDEIEAQKLARSMAAAGH